MLLLVVRALPAEIAGELARTAHCLLELEAALLTWTHRLIKGEASLLPFVCTTNPSEQGCINNGRLYLLIPRSGALSVSQGKSLRY